MSRSSGLVHVLFVNVAGEQVRRRDRHDGRRHQGTDGDGGKSDAGEPVREHGVKQHRDHCVVVHGARLGAGQRGYLGGDRHVAEQRDQPEQQAVRRQRGHVALDDVPAPAR